MSGPYDAAVGKAVAILEKYAELHGGCFFPTIKGKLWPIVEFEASRNGVDSIYVKRFKEDMHPIIGQVRRVEEMSGAYGVMETSGLIFLSPTLDLSWHRFIVMKEAAHLMLDRSADFVQSDIDIEKLLLCFAQFGQKHITQHYLSEMRATACAYELLLPFETRKSLETAYDVGDIAPAQIAKAARIPTEVVRQIMGDYRAVGDEVHARLRATAPKIHAVKG